MWFYLTRWAIIRVVFTLCASFDKAFTSSGWGEQSEPQSKATNHKFNFFWKIQILALMRYNQQKATNPLQCRRKIYQVVPKLCSYNHVPTRLLTTGYHTNAISVRMQNKPEYDCHGRTTAISKRLRVSSLTPYATVITSVKLAQQCNASNDT